MRLVKGNYVMNTTDETVIKAYKLNGFTEQAEADEKPAPAKVEKPKKTTTKK